MPLEPSDILRREFDRIAEETDKAFAVFIGDEEPRAEADYHAWAALLLKYHAALTKATGAEPPMPPQSMKGKEEPDAVPSSSKVPTPDRTRAHPADDPPQHEPPTHRHSGGN